MRVYRDISICVDIPGSLAAVLVLHVASSKDFLLLDDVQVSAPSTHVSTRIPSTKRTRYSQVMAHVPAMTDGMVTDDRTLVLRSAFGKDVW